MKYSILFLCIGCCFFSFWIYIPDTIPLITQVNENPTYDVYFCPKDNCTKVIVEILNKSTSINCAFYDVEQQDIVTILKEKNATVYVDKDTKSTYGIPLKTPGLMHHKFCILDDTITITGSTNPTYNGLNLNRNNLIIINSTQITQAYQDEFNELQQGIYSKGNKSKNKQVYFCPDDLCEEKIVKEIDNAKSTIYIMAFTFTSTKIANHLILAKQRNVSIEVIFENRQRSFWQADFLTYQDIPTYVYNQNGILHHKVFLIDTTVITGSFNPTAAATEKNEENFIVIPDQQVYEQYFDEFKQIKAISQPLNRTMTTD